MTRETMFGGLKTVIQRTAQMLKSPEHSGALQTHGHYATQPSQQNAYEQENNASKHHMESDSAAKNNAPHHRNNHLTTPDINTYHGNSRTDYCHIKRVKAQLVLDDVVAFLDEYRLMPSPDNYQLAYEYCITKDPVICRETDAIITKTGRLSGKNIADILEKTNGQTGMEKLNILLSQSQKLIENSYELLQSSGQSQSEHAEALQKSMDQISKDKSKANAHPALQSVEDQLASLLDVAGKMLKSTVETTEKFKQSSTQISQLQTQLDKAVKEANEDWLTGLANRAKFDKAMEELDKSSKERRKLTSMAIIDLDHFKQINDDHGHDTGDRLLQNFARKMEQSFPDADCIARYGGEEFTIISSAQKGTSFADRLDAFRKTYHSHKFVNSETGENIGHVSFSAGLANVADFEDSLHALNAADRALYQAKSAGRNQLAYAEPDAAK